MVGATKEVLKYLQTNSHLAIVNPSVTSTDKTNILTKYPKADIFYQLK